MELIGLDKSRLLQTGHLLRAKYMNVAILEVGVVLHHLLLLIGLFEQRAHIDVSVCITRRRLR